MAEEQEKDNTWVIAGVAIAAVIVLVVMLKQDETKHLESGAVAASNAEVFKKVEARHTSNNTGNVGN
ncbi:MAG: hypothetical protein QX198_02805 [Methylococcaceae bacterium]